jgi:hypothetical protein
MTDIPDILVLQGIRVLQDILAIPDLRDLKGTLDVEAL